MHGKRVTVKIFSKNRIKDRWGSKVNEESQLSTFLIDFNEISLRNIQHTFQRQFLLQIIPHIRHCAHLDQHLLETHQFPIFVIR